MACLKTHNLYSTFHVTINDRWLFLRSCCTTHLEQSPWNAAKTFVTSLI